MMDSRPRPFREPQRGAVPRGAVPMLRAGLLPSLIALVLLALTGLAGCASGPVPPDWPANAHGALQRGVRAALEGRDVVEAAEFQRARAELSRTGDPARVAQAELLRCAVRAAALELGPCSAFELLRADATALQQAYGDWLAGRLPPTGRGLLPAPQQAVLNQPGAAALARIDDPLSRLLAAAMLLRDGLADPAVVQLAVDTASAQGWRRPLLAWLGVQLRLAEAASDETAAARIRRRISLVAPPD